MENPWSPGSEAWYEREIANLKQELAAQDALRVELRSLAVEAAQTTERALAQLERTKPVLQELARWCANESDDKTLEYAYLAFQEGIPS